jgi:hypothetical protein
LRLDNLRKDESWLSSAAAALALAMETAVACRLYPSVRDYVATRCFGRKVNLESDVIRSHLARLEIQEGIAKYLARKIAELTIDQPRRTGSGASPGR